MHKLFKPLSVSYLIENDTPFNENDATLNEENTNLNEKCCK